MQIEENKIFLRKLQEMETNTSMCAQKYVRQVLSYAMECHVTKCTLNLHKQNDKKIYK